MDGISLKPEETAFGIGNEDNKVYWKRDWVFTICFACFLHVYST